MMDDEQESNPPTSFQSVKQIDVYDDIEPIVDDLGSDFEDNVMLIADDESPSKNDGNPMEMSIGFGHSDDNIMLNQQDDFDQGQIAA